MPNVNKSVLVLHSDQQMFDLVRDIESYPEFLPWCGGAQVQRVSDSEVRGQLSINFKGVRQSFTTLNHYDTDQQYIDIKLVDGPFKALSGRWSFHALTPEACKVELWLKYEFSSRFLATVVGPVFNQIANTFIEAFVKRAEQIYGS